MSGQYVTLWERKVPQIITPVVTCSATEFIFFFKISCRFAVLVSLRQTFGFPSVLESTCDVSYE